MPSTFTPTSNIFMHFREYDDFLFYYAADSSHTDFVMHSHDICELLFLKKGDLTYNVDGRSYQLSPNCLILTRPFERHNLTFNSTTEYERYVFLFDEKKLAAGIYEKIPSNIDIINFDGNALVCSLFQKIDYYLKTLEPEEFENILLHIIQEALYNIRLASKTRHLNNYRVNPLINDAIKYIDANILKPLTIDTICEELHITKSYLHKLFVKYLQISPMQYILSKKLAIAQRELRMGKKASEVYLTCGFIDYSTFYRDYKKHFGHAPSDEINTAIVREIYS